MKRAAVDPATLLVVALVGVALGLWAPKPKFMHGESRRAEASIEASAKVEEAASELSKKDKEKESKVSASLVQIKKANAETADSPQRSFIDREIDLVTPFLEPADYEALLAAERRRLAMTEGKLALADRLYADAAKDNERLAREAEKLEQKFRQALEQRREVDMQLAEAAAAVRAREQLIGGILAVLVLVGVLYLIRWLNSVPLKDLAVSVSSIKKGEDSEAALDRILSLSQQDKIRRIVHPS